MKPEELKVWIREVRLAAGHNRFSIETATRLAEICTLATEAAQHWRFFEVAAAGREVESQRADDWREVALELARHVRPGWEDADTALAAFRAQSGKTYPKPALTPSNGPPVSP